MTIAPDWIAPVPDPHVETGMEVVALVNEAPAEIVAPLLAIGISDAAAVK